MSTMPPSSSLSPGSPASDEASLVEKHRIAVQSSWKLVEDGLGTDGTALFYDRLFESYPDVKPMFENSLGGDFDVNEQAEKLFHTVGTAVDYLSDVQSIVPMLEDLGRKHAVAWNVKREQYDAVGECLIWTLKTSLQRQDAWNSDVADAWVWAYQMIAKVMIDAGEKKAATTAMTGRKVSFSEMKQVESESGAGGEDDKNQKANEETQAPAAAAGPLTPSIRSLIRAGITHRDDIELRPQSVALLVVDVQKELSTIEPDSPHLDYAIEAFPRMIKNAARIVRKMRSNRAKLVRRMAGETTTTTMATGSECVFTYCEALTDDSRDVSLDYKLSGPLLAKLPCPSRPAQFVSGVEPVRGMDVCLPKTSCSVFQSTNIDYVLKNLGVEQIVVCGQPIDQSVESAVRDAADRGYLVTVAVDACAAQSEADYERGMAGMRGFSRHLSTDEVISELSLES